MKIYWASIEFDILDPSEYENCVGGFVYLFVNSKDEEDASDKIKASIEEENFRINKIEFVEPYEDISWDEKEDQMIYDGLAKEAVASQDVIWDEISAYEARDEE